MQRYFLYLAYNGTRYHGWQVQPNGATVQERIEEALTLLLRREMLRLSGREERMPEYMPV